MDIENYCSDILLKEFLKKYTNKKVNWKNGLSYIVYKRTYSRTKNNGETEEFWETIARCINGAQKIGAQYTQREAERLFDYMFNFKCLYAGRMLWQLGTPLVDRFSGNSLINCFYTNISSIDDFCFLFENLMLGGGVGYSVRREHVHELPRIKSNVNIIHENTKDADFIVPDSRGGWVELLRKTLDSFFYTGKSFTYSTILVRGYGEPIKTFGGTASGPKILIEGIEKICQVCKHRENKKLRSIDALDICNIIGSIVVSGNVRRSAQIALGDADDHLFLKAKRWDEGNIPNWRSMSNNTICADEFDYISNLVWEGYNGTGEPYGFFNLGLTQSYGRLKDKIQDVDIQGLNPCLTKDTWILTSSGAKQIKDLLNEDFIVIDNGIGYNATKFYFNGYKDIFKLTTSNGYEIKSTDNHKFLKFVSEKQPEEWTELKNLKIGDLIKLQNQNDINWGDTTEFNKGWLLGNLVGDGTFADDSAILRFWGDNKNYMLSYATTLIKRELGARKDLGSAEYDEYNRISLSSKELLYFAHKHGIFRNNKYNLELIEKTSSSLYKGFISGLFDADGSVQGEQTKGVSIRLTSISKELLKSVQRMLSRLGIISTIYYNRSEAGYRLLPDGHGNHKKYWCQSVHELCIANENIIKYLNKIGFQDNLKSEKLINIVNNYQRNPNKERFIDKIISIEYIGHEDVYDTTVDIIHSFDANGIVSHNCGEIGLENGGVCNLSELFLSNIESKNELIDCALLMYKTQKAVCSLNYLHERTTKIVHKNRRIGLGIGGICQSLQKLDWLDDCYKQLKNFDKEWSKKRGWPESIKLTTIKPSGTISLVSNSSPGIHPSYSKYYIRRVRMGSNDKLVQICKDHGYKTEFQINFDNSIDRNTIIVEFPCYSGENVKLAKNMTAIQQLELLKKIQTDWADNAVSCTVYYHKEELKDIKEWLNQNYDNSVKSVSFLLHKDTEHGFKQPPYQEITEEKYNELIKDIKPFDIIKTENKYLEGLECSSGVCPIR